MQFLFYLTRVNIFFYLITKYKVHLDTAIQCLFSKENIFTETIVPQKMIIMSVEYLIELFTFLLAYKYIIKNYNFKRIFLVYMVTKKKNIIIKSLFSLKCSYLFHKRYVSHKKASYMRMNF